MHPDSLRAVMIHIYAPAFQLRDINCALGGDQQIRDETESSFGQMFFMPDAHDFRLIFSD